MWKAFTSAVLGVLLLTGCAASGSKPAPAPDPRLAAAVEGSAVGRPLPPIPEVSASNAQVFARATQLLQEQRLVEAEALLLELTTDQPELAGPWINLAQVYLAQEREDEAVGALQLAVLANPGNCHARTELGVLLRRRGDFGAAEANYLACLEYQPDYQAAYLNLGILYDLYLGRLDDALAAYRQYQTLAVEPDRRVNVWVVDLQRRLGS
ncbi:MAG: tetratricopeptide repeat protein [Pseudomonadales bacterium]